MVRAGFINVGHFQYYILFRVKAVVNVNDTFEYYVKIEKLTSRNEPYLHYFQKIHSVSVKTYQKLGENRVVRVKVV